MQAVALGRGGVAGVLLGVDPSADIAGDAVTVPVEKRPVDVEQPFRARGSITLPLTEIRHGARGDGCLGEPLREVRVPQDVMLEQGRAGAVNDKEAPFRALHGRDDVETDAEVAV